MFRTAGFFETVGTVDRRTFAFICWVCHKFNRPSVMCVLTQMPKKLACTMDKLREVQA